MQCRARSPNRNAPDARRGVTDHRDLAAVGRWLDAEVGAASSCSSTPARASWS